MGNEGIIKKLELVKDKRNVAGIGGKYWSSIYFQAYIDIFEDGGELTIKPHVTTELLYSLLASSPVFVNICSYVTHGLGRLAYPDQKYTQGNSRRYKWFSWCAQCSYLRER